MDLNKKIEATRQLGEEFLTWLMGKSVMQEGMFQTEAGPVELWFEDKITFVSPFAGAEMNILKGEAPAEGSEALMALRKGKLIGDAKLSVTFQNRRWDFSFAAGRFALSAVKVPAVLSDTEEEAVVERFDLLATLEEVLGGMYEEFLTLRLDDGRWKRECRRFEEWVKS